MATSSSSSAKRFIFCLLALYCLLRAAYSDVKYDSRGLIVDGERRILFSGSIHYPRSDPEMWEGLIQKAKDGGLDAIDTYVFWNLHEPSPGRYDFEGRKDLVRFLKIVQKSGLYAHLRIGPYVCAEWNFGGFPVWLKYVPGISFRTDNEPFKREMQRFTEKIVNMMKDEKLFESQGGPIVISQIENEYGRLSKGFGEAGHRYMTWAAKMATSLNTGVPWVMCKQDDAPASVIDTCNGFYCDWFSPNRPESPTMWTEAWTAWFTEFGGPVHQRPVEDLAFAVARFIQKGGSFVNYYMYHGGTNFGRTGGPYITTSYDYDAPIDEYGLIREPKYSHLKELHRAVKLCELALVSSDPNFTSLGKYSKAVMYSSEGKCAAFLSNYDTQRRASVSFGGTQYTLPPWSISILKDCKHEIFNTANVEVRKSQTHMQPSSAEFHSWETLGEDAIAADEDSKIEAVGLWEQISVTRDASDYLWYVTSVDLSQSESLLHRSKNPTLTVASSGDALHVFVNGHLAGSAFGNKRDQRFKFSGSVKFKAGTNTISLLSVAIGLPNSGAHYESYKKGVLGPVVLEGLDHGSMDLSRQKWTYQIGLRGEKLNLASPEGSSSVNWVGRSLGMHEGQPLTWYKASFDAPEGDEPLGLDMGSMGKGQAWINGESIGRYWTKSAEGNCTGCNYAVTYRQTKCQAGCGQPTQRWYHVPRSWLKPSDNRLVLFEEIGGDPSKITLSKRITLKNGSSAEEVH